MKLEDQRDLIYNCIASGMDIEDAMILAEATPATQALLRSDPDFMSRCKVEAKTLERDLLKGLMSTLLIQQDKGKDHGTIWLLGKVNPRFSDKPESGDKPGVINIRTQNVDLKTLDTVEIKHNTEQPVTEDEGTIEHVDGHLLNTNALHTGEKY